MQVFALALVIVILVYPLAAAACLRLSGAGAVLRRGSEQVARHWTGRVFVVLAGAPFVLGGTAAQQATGIVISALVACAVAFCCALAA